MEEKKLKALLVDDDVSIRSIYADVFRANGFEVAEAADGMEGFDKAIAEKPDVIFTGIIMPKMDGFSMKDALDKNVATSKIPVFMLSHMGREEDRKRAIEMGVKDFYVLGMIGPKSVVEEILSYFTRKEYLLSFNPAALDAMKLAADFGLGEFVCDRCSGKKVLSLEIEDAGEKEFKARFVCPNCR